jgi:F-type H+-transporting ATPase subunit delta
MLKGAVAERYARALFEIASEKGLIDKVEQELTGFREAMEVSQDLRRLFYHPQVPSGVKKEVTKEVLGADAEPCTVNFVNVVLDARREIFFKDILAEYTRLVDETRNVVEVEVTSAVEVTSDDKDGLIEALSKVTGKDVRVGYQVKPEILGGLVVKIGNRVIDSSITRQLERLKNQVREIRVG